jgi:ADP-ribosylglycohydrolase
MNTSEPSEPGTTLDRALGALYGVALGDAMGMPGELWSRPQIQRHFGEITEFLAGPDGHFVVDGFVAAQVTDDTQQMVMLAESIGHADGQIDVATLGTDLVAWADRVGASEGHFLGPTSAKVIERLRQGADPLESGVAGTTNGAAMRIAPIGVLCPSDDLEALLAEVAASCKIAHHTNIAIAGAAMIAAGVSTAIDAAPGEAPAQTMTRVVDAALRAAARGMDMGTDVAGASLVERTKLGVAAAYEKASDEEFLQYIYDVVGASTETTESVPAALAIVVRAGGDPVRSALLSANLGGDTDTIGAMAGGVSGALGGFASIPADLVERLNAVNDLPLTRLAAMLTEFRVARQSGAVRS